MSNIAPEFLFEQLTLLSQQKESLELRFQDRMKRLVREREMIREEVRQHTKETLLSLWQELGLPEDLIPNLSLEAAANRGAKRTALAKAPRTQPEVLIAPAQASNKSNDLAGESELIGKNDLVEESQEQALPAVSHSQSLNKTAMEFAVAEPIMATMNEDSQEQSGEQDLEGLSAQSHQVVSLSPQELSAAEAVLRDEIFSTPPMERLEKLSELGALKREIELSQPMSAVSPPPPDWSSPPYWDAPPAVVSLAPEEHLNDLSEKAPDLELLAFEDQDVSLSLEDMLIDDGFDDNQDNNFNEDLDLNLVFDDDTQESQENQVEEFNDMTLPGPAELHHTADSKPLELNVDGDDLNTFDDIDEAEVDNLIDELKLELTSSVPSAEPLVLSELEESLVANAVDTVSSSTWEPMIIDDFDFETQVQTESTESSASND